MLHYGAPALLCRRHAVRFRHAENFSIAGRLKSLGPLIVWLVLLGLLAGSAWSAFFPLGKFNPTINLLLAALMLFLLAAFLMNLKDARPVLRLVAAAGLFWVLFLFTLTFTDYLSRRSPQPLPAAGGAAMTAPERGFAASPAQQ